MSKYLFIATLLCLLAFPQKGALSLRSSAISCLSPLWSGIDLSSSFLLGKLFAFRYIESPEESAKREQEVERLELENGVLLRQIGAIREWLIAEEKLAKEVEQLKLVRETDGSFFERRSLSLAHRVDSELHALPATVIFREPATWGQTVWIDVGDDDNANLSCVVVAKNSPVLIGSALAGVIERVEKKRSLVRLITDPTLKIAVRAVRGSEQDRHLLDATEELLTALKHRPEFREKRRYLEVFREQIATEGSDAYLAKGVLHGYSMSLGRSPCLRLSGDGFNYDYEDEEGPARDLRTGQPFGSQETPLALIQPGDLLLTSGLDALFPEGLRVAIVDSVAPLAEGAVSYTIEAKAIATRLHTMRHVRVLPPIR